MPPGGREGRKTRRGERKESSMLTDERLIAMELVKNGFVFNFLRNGKLRKTHFLQISYRREIGEDCQVLQHHTQDIFAYRGKQLE